MKYKAKIRCIAIVFYLLIILKGELIGLPFFLWLTFNAFNFGSIDQLYALIAIAGLVMIFRMGSQKETLNSIVLNCLCFYCLTIPILARLTSVPLILFSYLTFTVPTTLFLLLYTVSIILSAVELRDKHNQQVLH